MAISKTSLEYISLSTGNWTKAVNADGNDAVVMLNVEQSINASAKADVILSNRSPDPSSSNPANARGPLTNAFAEFQRIRLVHQEIGIPIFSGRIYRIRDVYDAQYGQTIRVVAFDALKELREFPIEDAEDSLESIDTTSSNVGGYDVRKRSQVIKYMLDELDLKDKNLLTTDVDHFEDSWSTDSLGDKKLNLTKLDRHVAGVMHDLATADPVKNSSATAIGESGYDYRVEPRFLSSAVAHKPIESLHYFMRGTRPGKGGAYGASAAPVLTTTTTDSLTIEYTNSSSAADSGLKQTMMPQYEFDKPKAELYTAVVCHYTDEGKEDESANEESSGKTEGVVTFELLKGTALSGTFVWANKGLDVNKKGVVNVPENLTYGGNVVAVAQWQNTASNYLLISNINETHFPTTGSVTLTGATSSATFTFNAATGRMKTKYGVERPVRIQRPLSSNLGIIRDEIVSRLVGRTDLEIVRGKFHTVKYPIVYHDLPSNSSRSSNTITWTGTVAARTRGVRKGHIIAEIDSLGQYTRYAYISAVASDTSITYGSSATDTSDGTALNSSNTIRVVIPLRPGDVIKVVNAQSDVNTDQVILSLGYDESPGMFAARYETVGSNNKFNNIYEEGEDLRSQIAAVAPKKFPDATKPLAETSFFFDGFVNRGVNPSSANDYRQIHWTNAAGDTSGTAGTLTMGDGSKYTIACANSATLTTAEHTIFFRPTTARATANKSDTTFQVILSTNYKKDADDIYIGWCKASDNKRGAKAVLVLAPQFTSKDLFASGQNGTLTEALLSKSAQEYTSDLELTAITASSDSWRQLTWAQATLSFADGDSWTLAAKSGSNYSVTSNGSSFSNITAFAANSTYYAFIDTADTASGGTLTVKFTTNYNHISVASDGTFFSSRVLLALIAVPAADATGYKAPRVFPMNNRSLTVNAAAIAAESITATHITATAIDTTHIKLTGTNGIGGLTSAGNINLSNAENTLSLDSTAESSSKKHVDASQRDGGGYAYTGLNGSGRIKLPIGTGDGAKFYSYGQTSGVIVVMDNLGLIGKSGVGGSFPNFTGGTTQFEISAVDGEGKFGAGAGILSASGLEISQTSGDNTSNPMIKFTSSTGSTQIVKYNVASGTIPASTMYMGRSDMPAGWALLTNGQQMGDGSTDPSGFIYAGTRTIYTTLGRDTTGGAFAGLFLKGSDAFSTFHGTPTNTYGYLWSKADGKLYFKSRSSANGTVEYDLTGGGGGSITVQEEGSSLSTGATTLNFVGSGVTASGTGATKTITVSSGGASLSGTNTWTAVNTYEDPVVNEMGMTLHHEGTNPPTPSSGTGRIYMQNDILYFKDDSANVHNLLAAGQGVVESGWGESGWGAIAAYKPQSGQTYSTTIEDVLTYTGSTKLGYWTTNGNIIPFTTRTVQLGLGHNGQASSDIGVYMFCGGLNGLGDPPFSFEQYPSWGMSFKLLSAGNFQANGYYHGHLASSGSVLLEGLDNETCWFTQFGMVLNTRYTSNNSELMTFRPYGNNGGALGSAVNQGSVNATTDRRWGGVNAYDGSFAGVFRAFGTDTYMGGRCWMSDISAQVQSSSYVDVIIHNTSKGVHRESSSAKVKNNIRDLEVDTSKLYDLQERTFETIPPPDTDIAPETAFGLIAEEVYATMPVLAQLGREDFNDESSPIVPIGVDYKRLSVLLLTELRKLKERIEVLEGD